MSNSDRHRWWLTAASFVMIGWLAAHLIGVGMTRMFESTVGFFPVWFLDCIACSGTAISLPYRWPALVLGVSISGLIAGAAAAYLLATRFTPYTKGAAIAGTVLLLGTTFHAAVTWAYKFPSSLPTLLAAVAVPAMIAMLSAIGLIAATDRGALVRPTRSLRERTWGWVCLASGMVAAVMLGGVTAVLATALCGWRAAATDSRWERALAVSGAALALVGVMVRLRVRVRFPDTIDLF